MTRSANEFPVSFNDRQRETKARDNDKNIHREPAVVKKRYHMPCECPMGLFAPRLVELQNRMVDENVKRRKGTQPINVMPRGRTRPLRERPT
jgi:hypothetical protein